MIKILDMMLMICLQQNVLYTKDIDYCNVLCIILGNIIFDKFLITTSGLKGSLERLQLDYVDIVFANKPDTLTPMEGRPSTSAQSLGKCDVVIVWKIQGFEKDFFFCNL